MASLSSRATCAVLLLTGLAHVACATGDSLETGSGAFGGTGADDSGLAGSGATGLGGAGTGGFGALGGSAGLAGASGDAGMSGMGATGGAGGATGGFGGTGAAGGTGGASGGTGAAGGTGGASGGTGGSTGGFGGATGGFGGATGGFGGTGGTGGGTGGFGGGGGCPGAVVSGTCVYMANKSAMQVATAQATCQALGAGWGLCSSSILCTPATLTYLGAAGCDCNGGATACACGTSKNLYIHVQGSSVPHYIRTTLVPNCDWSGDACTGSVSETCGAALCCL
ncbi:MAG: hypothetical protein KF718_17840 [Polyangiaceae bacterium]|nr:hypothetical protein [Polyangiaceae bacterium]